MIDAFLSCLFTCSYASHERCLLCEIEICWLRPNQNSNCICKRSNYCRSQANLWFAQYYLHQNQLDLIWFCFCISGLSVHFYLHQIENLVGCFSAMCWNFFSIFFLLFGGNRWIIHSVCVVCCGNSCLFHSLSHFHCLFCVYLFLSVLVCLHLYFSFFTFVCTSSNWLCVLLYPNVRVLSVLQLSSPTNIRKHCHGKSDRYDLTKDKGEKSSIQSYNCVHINRNYYLMKSNYCMLYVRWGWKLRDQKLINILRLLLTRSHLSTQREWNSWEHGSTRSTWRISKSHMHTTHDVWSPTEIRTNRTGKNSKHWQKIFNFINK